MGLQGSMVDCPNAPMSMVCLMKAAYQNKIDKDFVEEKSASPFSNISRIMGGVAGGLGLFLAGRAIYRIISSSFPSFPRLKPVSRADSQRALAALRDTWHEDFDSYLQEIEPTTLLQRKIGPTKDCLTVEGLADCLESPLEMSHLAQCKDCSEVFQVYQSVKQTTLDTRHRPDIECWLEPVDRLEIGDYPFKFKLHLQSNDPTPSTLDQIHIESGFGNIRCENIQRIPEGASAGATYVAHCVAKAHAGLLADFKRGSDFCDWIKVTGKTGSGTPFTAAQLVQLTRKKGTAIGEFSGK